MQNYIINTLPHDNSTITIQTIWNNVSIAISLYSTDDKKGFRGTLLKSALATTANALELNVDAFIAESKEALCSQNGLPNFAYFLDGELRTFKFCKEGGFRITYGEVQLEEQPDAIDEILRNAIKLNESKEQKIEMLRSDIRRMDKTFNEMKMALEKCVEEKVQMENKLLTKFNALLNAKKEKIFELEQAIKNRSSIGADDFESDGSGDSDPDYCSQAYVREKSPAPSTSIQSVHNDPVTVPKRSKKTDESIGNAEASKPTSTPESMDIYERETELLLDDM